MFPGTVLYIHQLRLGRKTIASLVALFLTSLYRRHRKRRVTRTCNMSQSSPLDCPVELLQCYLRTGQGCKAYALRHEFGRGYFTRDTPSLVLVQIHWPASGGKECKMQDPKEILFTAFFDIRCCEDNIMIKCNTALALVVGLKLLLGDNAFTPPSPLTLLCLTS